MAIHDSPQSMLYESLPEMLAIAEYCLTFSKDPEIWASPGCYGIPAALLLLSIVDSIGSYIRDGDVFNHFAILNDKNYYNQNFSTEDLRILYNYRNKLSHNSSMSMFVGLKNDPSSRIILEEISGRYWLNLTPFFNISVVAVNKFLLYPEFVINNKTILKLYSPLK